MPSRLDPKKCALDLETPSAQFRLGRWEGAVRRRLEAWSAAKFSRRLWQKDPTLWFPDSRPELTDRLGWLELPESMHAQIEPIGAFAEEAVRESFETVVLLGMGGSSLAPEVFQETFGNSSGHPRLRVLDSTHPLAVMEIERETDLRKTLFLVSSKSGTTPETLSFFYYFWDRVEKISRRPGAQFVAITDPGTPLLSLARERGFRRSFEAPADVGGRYAALTPFGLVPASLIGIDIHVLLDQALAQARVCGDSSPEAESPGLQLGAAMAELAGAGRDKITFSTSSSLNALPSWIEQLIAESTGKDGKGILPVADESLASPDAYGDDRFFVVLRLKGERTGDRDPSISRIESAGHPSVHLEIGQKSGIAQEFFRWEVAVAAAGAALGIHPFNQPDVQLAKDLARKSMRKSEAAPSPGEDPGVSIENLDATRRSVAEWSEKLRKGDYVSIQAYLSPSPAVTAALQEIRHTIRNHYRCSTTIGYGPRFLHSTGQLHKGGPDSGLFLQIVDAPAEDLPVPETGYTFGALIRAQALGDYEALLQRGRRVLRLRLGRDVTGGLQKLVKHIAS